jgi:REP element-mobilizing transposase RayT
MDQSEKFHRNSLRLNDFDYSQIGAYFVTICTKNRQCLFGKIQHGTMQLSPFGRVASAQWQQLPYRFPYLEFGEWVIMPNHIHGILVITGRGEASQDKRPCSPESLIEEASPLRPNGTTPGSVGEIIQIYKSVTSRKISAQKENLKGSVWQRNYYEHVIRNERDLQAISDYILTNPQNWKEDTEYQD